VGSVYASDPGALPDSAFAPGELRHLVAGNRGRLLDDRRTPVTVIGADADRGSFVVRVEAFEDSGAQWELGLEEIGRFQFAEGASPAGARELAELERAATRFDRELVVECEPAAREASLLRLRDDRQAARSWLQERATGLEVDLAGSVRRREGSPELYGLLDEFLAEHALADIEAAFTSTFVSNPRSGEVVKGHAIVLAELGLSPYRGKVPRDPSLFAGAWSRARRAEHILRRLALTQAVLAHLGAEELTLYRAAAGDGPLPAPRPASLVSATFAREVAEAHFAGGPATRSAALWRELVPIERVLMTFLETRAMNERFREAEAVLLG
jgi:hypothetical protein